MRSKPSAGPYTYIDVATPEGRAANHFPKLSKKKRARLKRLSWLPPDVGRLGRSRTLKARTSTGQSDRTRAQAEKRAKFLDLLSDRLPDAERTRLREAGFAEARRASKLS